MGLLMCQLMSEWFTHGAYEMVCRTHNHRHVIVGKTSDGAW